MNRLWSRVGVRVTSVGLLVLGVVGGVYLGQDREVQQRSGLQASAEAQLVEVDADEMQLLKQRHSEHAAARAWQRQAEDDAAAKAATEAKAAAAKARKVEKKAIEKKAAEKAAEEKAAESSDSDSDSDSGKAGPSVGPIPDSCGEYSGNKATGCALLLKAGFDLDQMPCLDKLWTKESHWRTTASNSSSGAYGIPQALPGSKMGSVASDWKTNPATQIKWGLGYIEGRYGSPCKAWSHSQSTGWY